MNHSVSPDGIDPDIKEQARGTASDVETVRDVLLVAATGAGIVLQPLVPGLLLAASVTPLLARHFKRVAADPPNFDFTLPVVPRQPTIEPLLPDASGEILEAAAAGVQDATLYMQRRAALGVVLSLAVSLDRAAAYGDAWLLAVERAQGAYRYENRSAIELRLGEAQHFTSVAQAALSTADLMMGIFVEYADLDLMPAAWPAIEQEREPEGAHAWPGITPGMLATAIASEQIRTTWLRLGQRHVSPPSPLPTQ